MPQLWAELDEDWKRKEERAIEQRRANAEAVREGREMPFVNPFLELIPKLEPDATPEQHAAWLREQQKICRPRPRKRHVL